MVPFLEWSQISDRFALSDLTHWPTRNKAKNFIGSCEGRCFHKDCRSYTEGCVFYKGWKLLWQLASMLKNFLSWVQVTCFRSMCRGSWQYWWIIVTFSSKRQLNWHIEWNQIIRFRKYHDFHKDWWCNWPMLTYW